MENSGIAADWICSELKFHRKPALTNVVKHTEQLCKKLVPRMKQNISAAELHEITSILGTIYGVLSDFTELPDDAKCTLSEASFVIDADRKLLVRPNQLVLRLPGEDEIVPYLISIPRDILAYERMFCQLGARETPSPDQYVMVLRMIHADSRDQIMHPNEREKAKIAMYGLFCLLQLSEEDQFTINGELYLPGGEAEEWKMCQACTLMFDDARLRPRLHTFEEPFMLPLSECGIRTTRYLPKDLLKRLPEANRPKFLSKVVEEIVDTDYSVTDCPVVRRISEKFTSEDFRDALIRIALYCLPKTQTEDVERVKRAVEGLQAIHVVGVDKLTTYLMHNGRRIPGSDYKKPYHVHGVYSESTITIFVREGADMSPTFCEKLTEVVNNIMGDIVKSGQYYVSRIIECEAGRENQYLDEKDIPSYGRGQSSVASDSFTPTPGSFVPLILHHLLKQDVQRLNPLDFAAMETEDPMENGEPGPPTYIHVKVVGIVEDEDNNEVATAALHYRVLVEPHQEIVVSALVLYTFMRDQEEIEQTSDSSSMELELHAQPSARPPEPRAPADLSLIHI